ncbi:CidA/LrgA family protein [Neobacillus cucumis]|uniref:CidA/LrgA family protein n=1 Tax=Neobacillus cucumis TaxID=1740721 RepID=UPI001E3F0184|nr:CidA/LrgA family protein [Neobacillus cucumis]
MIRYFVQFFTLLLFYSIGNGIVSWLQLPIPGSVAGLFLLFLALNFKVCELKWVEAIAQLHIKHITLLFIPFTVGIWKSIGIFQLEGAKLAVVLAISSLVVLLATAVIAETIETRTKRRKQGGKMD